jgi:hypothetical protein
MDQKWINVLSENPELIKKRINSPIEINEILRVKEIERAAQIPKDFDWKKFLLLNLYLFHINIDNQKKCEDFFIKNPKKIYNVIETEKENLTFSKTKKIFLFYHIYCKNDWWEIFEEQLQLIKESKLLENLEKIYINIIGDKNDLKKIKSVLNDKRIECLLTQSEYEFPTLEKIIEVSNKDEFYGIYIHTKASSYPKEYEYKHILNFWRKFMNHQILNNWEVCYEKIKSNDLVGSLFKDGNYKINEFWEKYSDIGKNCHVKYTDHFSGNFFWFDSNYFKQIKPLTKNQKLNRFNAEWLPFKNNPKYYTIYVDLDYWKEKLSKLNEIQR